MTFKVFSANNNTYLYDRQENRIVRIDHEDYLSFLEMENGIVNSRNEAVKKRFQEYGLCKDNELDKIEHPYTGSLEFYLNEQVEQVILQITQECNLRCTYCAYSGKYKNRMHSKKRMSFETACKAVDFLVKHSRCTHKCSIGFYGGEPLLDIGLIKKVVTYIEENYEEKEFAYMITTNATLLSDDIVDYFVEKNFSIMISIDGPQNIHNLNRCFKNGMGSYDIIMNNLSRIKERYPDYYSKCSTNTVISPDQDFKCVENFLIKDDVMKSLMAKLSLISDTGTNDAVYYGDAVFIEQREEELEHMLTMLREVDENPKNKLFGDYKQEIHRMYSALYSGCFHSKKGHPSGPCVAGAKKTFIDTEGNIYSCEKIPELEEMSLGNIDTGFLIDKVKNMINIAQITDQQCMNCWAFIFCFSCVVSCIDEDGISAEKRLGKCNRVKRAVLENLMNIVRLQGYGYSFNVYKSG